MTLSLCRLLSSHSYRLLTQLRAVVYARFTQRVLPVSFHSIEWPTLILAAP